MRSLAQKEVSGEGSHFRIPWLQTPHIFDVRIRPRNISSATGTKDLQVVTINLRVLSRPQESFLPEIFSNLGLDYDEVLRALASRRSHAAGAGGRGPALACTAPHSA